MLPTWTVTGVDRDGGLRVADGDKPLTGPPNVVADSVADARAQWTAVFAREARTSAPREPGAMCPTG